MKIHVTCNYCGNKWDDFITSMDFKTRLNCEICNEASQLKVREEKPGDKIDTYQGCPPFPEDKEDEIKITDFPSYF